MDSFGGPSEDNKKTTGNLAVRKIVPEWDGLLEKFRVLTTRFLTHEAIRTGKSKDEVVAQFEECNYCMIDLGKKSRLLLVLH